MVRLRDIALFVLKIYSSLKRQVKVFNKSQGDTSTCINGIKSKSLLANIFYLKVFNK